MNTTSTPRHEPVPMASTMPVIDLVELGTQISETPRSGTRNKTRSRPTLDRIIPACPVDPFVQARYEVFGPEQLAEDTATAIATYEWQRRCNDVISPRAHRVEIRNIEMHLEAIGDVRLPDGTERQATLWDLLSPVGPAIVHAFYYHTDTDDADAEVRRGVWGPSYTAMRRLCEYLCTPEIVLDYATLAKLGRPPARQIGPVDVRARYGTVRNPFYREWLPGVTGRPTLPVPSFAQWEEILDILAHRIPVWADLDLEGYPYLRAIAMIMLQSIIGSRPSEVCPMKQGHLFPDHVEIWHGGQKQGYAKNARYDRYGNALGSYRTTPFTYVSDRLVRPVLDWPESLIGAGFIAEDPTRALFPRTPGGPESCVTLKDYEADFQTVLLDIFDEPAVHDVLAPYLESCGNGRRPRRMRITPHVLRSIYATYRMDLLRKPGAPRNGIRRLMFDLGWMHARTALRYIRPAPQNPAVVQRLMRPGTGRR
jgi:integrase